MRTVVNSGEQRQGKLSQLAKRHPSMQGLSWLRAIYKLFLRSWHYPMSFSHAEFLFACCVFMHRLWSTCERFRWRFSFLSAKIGPAIFTHDSSSRKWWIKYMIWVAEGPMGYTCLFVKTSVQLKDAHQHIYPILYMDKLNCWVRTD